MSRCVSESDRCLGHPGYEHEAYLLPSESDWKLDQFKRDPLQEYRDSLLSDGTREELQRELIYSAGSALRDPGNHRFGVEIAGDGSGAQRFIFQFRVERGVFDKFFNARFGYRAHYVASPRVGRRFNDDCVRSLRELVLNTCGSNIQARHVKQGEEGQRYKDLGETAANKAFVESSLVPDLSKLWAVDEVLLPTVPTRPSLEGPRLEVRGELRDAITPCSAPWIELKGAFSKPNGAPYQAKCSVMRADVLAKALVA